MQEQPKRQQLEKEQYEGSAAASDAAMPPNLLAIAARLDRFCSPHGELPLRLVRTPEAPGMHLLEDGKGRRFPLFGGVPFLSPEPALNRLEWVQRASALLTLLKGELDAIAPGESLPQATDAQKHRLSALKKGKLASLESLVRLLAPLSGAIERDAVIHESMMLKVSPRQSLLRYGDNIFRDWAWGEAEVMAAVGKSIEALGPEPARTVLTLGAGPGRYSLEMHQALGPDFSCISDINPLFLMLLEALLSGETVPLCEEPLAPLGIENVAVLHRLRSEHRFDGRIALAFADTRSPCLAPGSFDVVLCPWLLDIQSEHASVFFRRVARIMPMGGRLLLFGSLAFSFRDPLHNLSAGEVAAEAAACGLDLKAERHSEGAYLRSPHAAGYRMERVTYFSFRKVAEVPVETDTHFNAPSRPAWVDNPDQAVPDLAAFRSFALRHRILSEAASQVNGRLSIRSMGRYLARAYKMSEADGVESVRLLLVRILDESGQY